MVGITKVISTFIENTFRRIKFYFFGNIDVRSAFQATPFGIDSSPIKGMSAIYSDTATSGKTVIIGYINKNQLAADGETRLFSLDSTGALKAYLWIKANGTIEIGGSTKNMVRFQELESGFNALKTSLNNFITVFNAHVHSAHGTPTATPGTSSTASIEDAKIDEIKTL